MSSSYPLFIQLHQLLCDFRGVECQSEAGQIQFWEKVLQYIFDGQTSCGPMFGGRRHCILQYRTSKSCQLDGKKHKGRLQRGER